MIPGATAIVITLGFTNALACFRVRGNAAILQAVEAGLVEYLHIGCGLIVVCEVNAPLEFEFLKLDGAGE